MKLSLTFAALLGASIFGSTAAFPSFGSVEAPTVPDISDIIQRAAAAGIHLDSEFADIIKRAENDPSLAAFRKRSEEIKAGGDIFPRAKRGSRQITTVLNPADFKYNYQDQYVDLTSDEHKFIPPGPGDIRGPCPALNILANHGYFNRNGVTTLTQGMKGINQVFGVGYDTGLVLNAYAVLLTGNVLDLSWSIGGAYGSKGLGSLTNLLFGEPKGIEAHNVYEGDASIVRKDYYDPTNPKHDVSSLHLPFFEDLLREAGSDSTPGKDYFTPEVMYRHKSLRRAHSIRTNPYYFASAFGSLVVTNAADRFVAEFAANNTADSEGFNHLYLDEPNLFAFFGVERRPDGSLEYKVGHERLLPSWVRRPIGAPFSLVDVVLSLLYSARTDPSLLSIGGNAGQVNTFTGVDVGDLSNILNVQHLLTNPDALTCFLYQGIVEELIPAQLEFIYKIVGDVLGLVNYAITAPWKKAAEAGGRPCENNFKPGALKKAYRKYPGSKEIKL